MTERIGESCTTKLEKRKSKATLLVPNITKMFATIFKVLRIPSLRPPRETGIQILSQPNYHRPLHQTRRALPTLDYANGPPACKGTVSQLQQDL